MRTFIGITLPITIREKLSALQKELASSEADMKWVVQSSLHITLKFIGDVEEDKQIDLCNMLENVSKNHKPIELGLGNLGAFRSIKFPRVVWVEITDGAQELSLLAEDINKGMKAVGLSYESRPFVPHLTLGRARSSKGKEKLSEKLESAKYNFSDKWKADLVTLYKSDLTPTGPNYTVLEEFHLANR